MNEIQIVIGSILTLGLTANNHQVAKVRLSSDDRTDNDLPRILEARFYVAKTGSKVASVVVNRGEAYCFDAIINRQGEPLLDKAGKPMVAIADTATIKKGTPLTYQKDELFVLQATQLSKEEWQDYR
jgi:hypothetical protein